MPAGHVWHASSLVALLKYPLGQIEHVVELALNVPGMHGRHAVEPVEAV